MSFSNINRIPPNLFPCQSICRIPNWILLLFIHTFFLTQKLNMTKTMVSRHMATLSNGLATQKKNSNNVNNCRIAVPSMAIVTAYHPLLRCYKNMINKHCLINVHCHAYGICWGLGSYMSKCAFDRCWSTECDTNNATTTKHWPRDSFICSCR